MKKCDEIDIAIPKDLKPKNGITNGLIRGKGWQLVRKDPKIRRNDPCTCGSGKKAKKCCYSPYR
jgi:uncharacterized protein YecA (UPF0149 family)